MAKNYKVHIRTGKAESNKVIDVQQHAGDKGQPVRIKAQAGAKYVLEEIGRDKAPAPDRVLARRHGKHLEIIFEDGSQPDLIIEDYYGEMPAGYNGLIGQAENGSFYEYMPEDPTREGFVPDLVDGTSPSHLALGGDEVSAAGAAVGVFAISPLWGALGLVGAAGGGGGGGGTKVVPTALSVDAVTADNTLNATEVAGDIAITGKVSGGFAAGDKVTLTVNGKSFIGQVLVDGSYSINVPAADLAGDADHRIEATITGTGGTQASAVRSYVLDIVPTQTVTITAVIDNEGSVTGTVANGGTTDDDYLNLNGTLSAALAAGEVVQVYDGYTYLGNAIVTGTTWTFADSRTLANGAHPSYTAKVVGLLGNTGVASAAYTVTINTLVPTITIESIADDAVNDSTALSGTLDGRERANVLANPTTGHVLVSGTCLNLDGQTITVTVNNHNYTATVATGGAWSVQVPDADALVLNHGNSYGVFASGTSTGGKTATDTNNSLRVNIATPDIPTVVNQYSAMTTPTLTGSAMKEVPGTPSTYIALQTGDTLSVTVNGVTVSGVIGSLPPGLSYDDTANTWSLDTATAGAFALTNGQTYDVGVTVTAGAVTETDISSGELLINTTPPTITLNALSGDGYLNASEATQSLTITGTTTAQVASTVTLTGLDGTTRTATVVAGTGGGSNTFSIDISAANVRNFANVNATKTVNASVVNQYGLSGSDAEDLVIDITAPVAVADTASTTEDTAGSLAGSVAGNDTGLQGGESFVLTNSVGTYGNLSLTSTGAYSYTVTDSAGLQALATDATETFSYQVTDVAGNHSTATLTVNISAVNDEPTGADKALTLVEEGSITLAVADFGFADVDGHSLTGVKITTLPTGGTLALSGTAVTANQVISTADIAAGHLVYTPVLGGFGANYANLQFRVQDSGATHNEAISANTITLNVTQLTRIVLDPVTADNTINAAESAGNITVTGTVSGAYVVGDQVTLHVNNSTVSVGVLADGSFSFTVPASSLVADADLTIEATINGTNGTSAQAQKTYAVDTAPPANVTVSLDAITGDDYLVTGETDTGVTHTLTGTVTGEFRAGDAVTLSINGQNYSGTVDSAGRFAVANVLGSDLKNDSDHTVAASFTASDAAGNTTTVATTRAYSLSGGNNDGMVTAISLQPVTGDNILDSLDAADPQTAITGKVTGVFAAGDVVTLSLNNTTFTGAVAADGSFSINVNTADLSADADLQIEARVTGTGGDTASASQHFALGGTNVTVISLNPVTADNIVNIAEALTTVPITGKVSGMFATTDTITLVVNGVSYTGQPASDGSFSINVSGAELVVDTDSRITASITGTGGSAATAAQDYGVILIGPSTSVTIDAISLDSGVSDSDFITNDNDGLTLTATLSNPMDAGEHLWYSKDNGATWTDISASVSGTAVSHTDANLTSSTTVQIQVRDAAGNVGGSDSKAIVIDVSGDNTQPDNQPDPNANAAVVSIDGITEDTGTSASDFVTKDNNGLTYSGSVTQFTANGAAIHLVLTNSAGTTVASTYVVPTMGSVSATSGSWNWTPALVGGIQADGQYTLSATVVDAAGNAITGATNDSQRIVIDASSAHKDDGTDDVNKSATISIGSIDDANASTTAANGSKDSGVSSTDFVTNDNTLTFTGSVAGFSSTEGGKVHLVVTRAGTAVVDQYLDPDSAGAWVYSNQASTLADGSYTITATIVDRAGNTVVAATPQTLVIDTSTTQKDDGSTDDNSAAAVAITSIHNASSSIDSGVSSSDFVTTDPTLVISGTTSNFTANGDLVHVRLYDQAGTTLLAQTWLTPSANTWSWDRTGSNLTDGTYQIRADIVDVAGNTVKAGSPQTLVIDNAVPTTTVSISAISLDTGDNTADFITNDNNGLTVSGTLSTALVNGQVLEYSNDNGATWTHITSSVSGVNVSYFDSALTSTATVQMRVVSQSGVAGAAVSQLVTIDAQAPAQTVVITDVLDNEGAATGTVAHGGVTDDTSLNLKGTLSAALGVGEVLKVYDGSTYLGNASVSGTVWTFVDTRTLSNNQSLSYSAKVEDVAGSTSAASNSYAVSINNSVPTITIGSISGDPVDDTAALSGTYDATERGSNASTVSTRPVLSGTTTALDGQTLSVTVNGQNYSALVSGGSWSVELNNSDAVALNHGSTYSVSVSGTTTGGKTATDTNNSLFINTALPDVPTVVTNHSGTLTPTLSGQVQKEDPSHPGTYIALEAGDILSVIVNGVTVTGTIGSLPAGLSYNASNSSWSLATDSSHGLASGNTYNVAVTATSGISVANPSGVSKSDISSGELVIDTTAPTITLNPVSGDGYMNATEAGQSLTLTGSTTAQVGSVVTLTGLDGSTRTTTVVTGNTFALTLSATEVAAFASSNVSKTVTASVVNLFSLSASDSKPLVIDIAAPVAVDDSASANEDITSLTGSVASNDTSLQGGESYSLQGTATGTYGSISLGSNGSWTYTVSNSAALNALQANATERFSYTVTDAAGNSSTASLTVTLTPVNDAPVNTVASASQSTDEDSAKVITGLSVADVDAASSAITVTLSVLHGTLNAVATTGVTIGNNGTASVTLSGSVADINDLLANANGLTYTPSANYFGSDTLTMLTDDGGNTGSGGALTDSDNLAITVTPVNDAPVVDAHSTNTAYTENGSALAANSAITLSDVDSATLTGATVTIGTGYTAGDTLAFTAGNGISGSYSNGVLTLSGTATVAQYQAALRSITYVSSSDNPTASSATRTLNWQVDDGQGANHASNVATSTVNITAVNDAPVVDAHGTNTAYTENGAALAANSAITLSDADSATLTGATITISGGLTTGDVLAFVDANGITGSYNSATGVLTLSGTATVAQYQAALQSVTYVSTSDNPTATSATRTLSWQVDDGQGANHASNVATNTITVTPVNDAPVVDAQRTNTAYTENEAAKVANSAITLSDVDSTTLSGATVTISSGRTTGDVLGFTAANGISGSYNSATGVLTLSGTATVAQYQAALQSVTYFSGSDAPTATSATRTLSWLVDDGQGANHASNVGTSTIAITAVDDAPTGANATLTAVEDTDLTLTSINFGFSDVDGHTLTGVTITTLPAVGTLKLNGVAVTANQFISKADIDAGLLKFRSALDGSGTAYDTLQFKVHDSGASNKEALSANTLTFNVTAVNDNPALRTMITATNEDSVYTVKVSDLIAGKFSDPDVGDSAKGITIQWINGLPSGTTFNMEWSADGSTNWTAFPTSILQGANTPGSALFLLQTATIRYTAAANYAGNVDVFVRVADSTMPSTVHDTTLNANVPLANGVRLYVWDYASSSGDTTKPLSNSAAIWTLITSPINDAPVLVTAGTVATVNEDASNNTAVSLWSTTPVYGPGGGSDEASQTLTYTITAVPSFISLYKSNGTTPVTANTTLTAAEFASLTYTTVANANGTGNVSFYVTDSGSGTAPNVNVLSNQSVSVTVNAVNDAPVGVNDTATATEAGGVSNATAGTNPAGNVITNDTDVDNATNTLTVKDVKAGSGSVTAVTAGTTSANGLSLAGSYGTLVIGADGSYTYTVDNANNAVQALNTSSAALSDVFTYTVKDPSGATSTATLTVAVNGANDAPVVVNAIADTTATATQAFSYTVASNAFTDVDNASLTYSATLADGSALPSWLTFNASTRTFSGTPTTEGTVSVKVTASDGSLSANDTFDIVLAVLFSGSFETALTGTFVSTNSTNYNGGKNVYTTDADNEFSVFSGLNTGAYWHIDQTQIAAGSKVTSLSANFQYFLSTTGGDGLNFSFGNKSAFIGGNYDKGYSTGLSVRLANGSTTAGKFLLYWNGTLLGTSSAGAAVNTVHTFGIDVDSTGAVTVTADGSTYLTATLTGWTTATMTGWEFGIGGRTGDGLAGSGWVDDLNISAVRAVAPVVLDLNRDGTFSYTHTLMDVTGDGRLDYTAWAGPQDGVLVWNKFGDGLVHDASQYAFAQYGGGTDLAGLAAGFDSNHDGVLDSSDAKFAEFGAWQDANGNGVVDAGEFKSLSELGVASVRLSSDATTRTPAEGVTETGHTAATMADGSSMAVADAAFDYRNATAEEQASHALAQDETVFKLSMGQVLDLSAVTGANALTEVDASADAAANTIRLTLADLLVAPEQAHTLKLTGDSNDTVVLDLSEWTRSDTTVTENGHTYAVYNAHAMMAEQLLIDQHMLVTQNG